MIYYEEHLRNVIAGLLDGMASNIEQTSKAFSGYPNVTVSAEKVTRLRACAKAVRDFQDESKWDGDLLTEITEGRFDF